MTEDGQPPHGSLLYLQQQGYHLTVHCETQPPPGEIPCRHYGDPPWDALIAKFGPGFIIPKARDTFLRALRCSRCGGKDLTLTLSPPPWSIAGKGKPD